MNIPILCTVRNCGAPLSRDGRRFSCANGHAFDVAKSGYVNLLQPQERRSKSPGDSAEAAAARRRVYERGIATPLLDAIAEVLAPSRDDVVLDAGCGDGWFLGELQRRFGFEACGVDISTPAIELAAKRYPDCMWIVANADRVVPVADHSVSKLMSVTARVNAPEFRRVLREGGTLLVCVAAPEDLIELRGEGKDRVARVLDLLCHPERSEGPGREGWLATRDARPPGSLSHARDDNAFTLVEQRRVTTHASVDAEAVRDLRLAIYRPRGATDLTTVTLSLDLLRLAVTATGDR